MEEFLHERCLSSSAVQFKVAFVLPWTMPATMVPKAIIFISAWASDCDSPNQTLQWKEEEKRKEEEELQDKHVVS